MKIIDTLPFRYELTESGTEGGPLRVRGIFQRADEKNANGRIYPRALWERILGSREVSEAIGRRRMIGEVDHPVESEMKLGRAAHLVTALSLNESGEVIGEFEILPTAAGKHLESLLKAGVECGISSRGEGSTVSRNGSEMIADDYRLLTFDVVASPSTRGAFPQVVQESQTAEDRNAMLPTFNEVSERTQSILEVDLSKTTQAQRSQIRTEIPSLVETLDRIAANDPGYGSLCKGKVEQLLARARVLESKSAPPVVEAQVDAAEKVIEEISRQAKQVVLESVGKSRKLAEELARTRRALAEALQVGEKLLERYKHRLRENRLMESAGDQILAEYTELSGYLKQVRGVAESRRPARKAAPAQPAKKESVSSRRVIRELVESGKRRVKLEERGSDPSGKDPIFEQMRGINRLRF